MSDPEDVTQEPEQVEPEPEESEDDDLPTLDAPEKDREPERPLSPAEIRRQDPDYDEIVGELAAIAADRPDAYQMLDTDEAEFVKAYDAIAPEIRKDRAARMEREQREREAFFQTPKGREHFRRKLAGHEVPLPRRSRVSEEDEWEAQEEREERFREWVKAAPDRETNLGRAAKYLEWKRARRRIEEEE